VLAFRGQGGGALDVVIPAPGPPAPLAVAQGPSRAAPSEHCYRCLQAAALQGCDEVPLCTGYDASGVKCVRCKGLHQPCQSVRLRYHIGHKTVLPLYSLRRVVSGSDRES
jgi:hypothetical protein